MWSSKIPIKIIWSINIMSLSLNGSNPVLTLGFGGIQFGSCTLFIKEKIPGSQFRNITVVNNKNFRDHSLTIDPSSLLGSGASLADLQGCELGWTVIFVNLDTSGTIVFSFNLDIQQSSQSIMPQPFFRDNNSSGLVKNSTSVMFSDSFKL
jgi:hypothetical protein